MQSVENMQLIPGYLYINGKMNNHALTEELNELIVRPNFSVFPSSSRFSPPLPLSNFNLSFTRRKPLAISGVVRA